ncbi:MAG: GspMb/PilO family protein [Pseudomonadota bacterium]
MSEFRFENANHPPIALAGFACVLVLALMIGGFRIASEIRTMKLELEDQQALIDRASQQSAADLPIAVYKTTTAEEARARLQSDVQALADAHDFEVETINPEDMIVVDGLVRIAVVVKGSIAQTALAPFLIALQESEPAILLDAVSLRRPRGRPSAEAAPRLPVRLGLAAYARP